MIITLTGQNNFLLWNDLRQRINIFVSQYTDMGLERLDGEEVEYDRIREALESLPFLASKKLVVLRAPSANKDFVEKAEHILGEVPDTTDVIIVESKLDKRLAYAKFLKKKTDYKEFNELDEHALSKWLVEQATVQGSTLYSNDAQYLVERVGANQQLLANELAKLAAYSSEITRETIDLLTEPTPQSTIFQLLDAAFAGNTKQMLKLYQEQRASKVEPQQIIAMLAWQLHILAIVKTAGERSDQAVVSEAKLSPYVVSKTRQITNHLTVTKLKELVHNLASLDLQAKTTPINLDDALQHYLLTINT